MNDDDSLDLTEGFNDIPFNITDDMSVDDEKDTLDSSGYSKTFEDVSPLLYTPMPKDLLTVDKISAYSSSSILLRHRSL